MTNMANLSLDRHVLAERVVVAMALTVRDLVSTPELGLALLAEGPGADRAVTWVHVSELRDPTPFLSGGELLLTTGIAFDGELDPD